ncbi:hypothetical protein AB0I82_29385 [Streptomyces sp. NPDC050315]|uniref:hypothetical protein n=1 Tax=Streptomyces sp. NPDC050315 TaxID=3155039 RepID=UPI003424B3BB
MDALTQSSAGVPGANESGDQWGAATAWGDLNGDGHADVALNYRDTGLVGRVVWFKGGPTRLGTPTGARPGQQLTP